MRRGRRCSPDTPLPISDGCGEEEVSSAVQMRIGSCGDESNYRSQQSLSAESWTHTIQLNSIQFRAFLINTIQCGPVQGNQFKTWLSDKAKVYNSDTLHSTIHHNLHFISHHPSPPVQTVLGLPQGWTSAQIWLPLGQRSLSIHCRYHQHPWEYEKVCVYVW